MGTEGLRVGGESMRHFDVFVNICTENLNLWNGIKFGFSCAVNYGNNRSFLR